MFHPPPRLYYMYQFLVNSLRNLYIICMLQLSHLVPEWWIPTESCSFRVRALYLEEHHLPWLHLDVTGLHVTSFFYWSNMAWVKEILINLQAT